MPIAALVAFAVVAIAWVASSEICSRPVAMSMAGMPGMADMPGMAQSGPVMLCPVVLALLGVSFVLAAMALIGIARDPHRAVTNRVLLRSLAHAPVVRSFAVLATAGGAAIAAIIAVDGGAPLSCSLIASLAVVVAGIALVAILASLAFARVVLACFTRLLLALGVAIGDVRTARPAGRLPRVAPLRRGVLVLSSGRGLRAPPAFAH